MYDPSLLIFVLTNQNFLSRIRSKQIPKLNKYVWNLKNETRLKKHFEKFPSGKKYKCESLELST